MVLVFLSDDVDIRLTHIENDLQKCVESFANVAQQSSQVARQDSQSSVMVNTDADQPLQVTDVAIWTQPHANAEPLHVVAQPVDD